MNTCFEIIPSGAALGAALGAGIRGRDLGEPIPGETSCCLRTARPGAAVPRSGERVRRVLHRTPLAGDRPASPAAAAQAHAGG